MVDKKKLEADKGTLPTDADKEVAKVEVTESSTENEEPSGNKSLRKEGEKPTTRNRTQAEKMFNDFISTIRSRQEDFSKAISDYTTTFDKPLADVIETDNEIIIKTDLPNVKKSDINVNLTENTVEIMAKFDEEYNEEEVDYIRRERNYGETKKLIQLPSKIKTKEVTAKFEDSILTINLPKVEGEKIKVDIK
jgi:HSP20 family protein